MYFDWTHMLPLDSYCSLEPNVFGIVYDRINDRRQKTLNEWAKHNANVGTSICKFRFKVCGKCKKQITRKPI
jgi:hypothetical protein